MKLTMKTVKREVEATEPVCEIAHSEFDDVCAKAAATVVMQFVGDDATINDLRAGLELASVLATFVSDISKQLFNPDDTTENPDKNEKEEN